VSQPNTVHLAANTDRLPQVITIEGATGPNTFIGINDKAGKRGETKWLLLPETHFSEGELLIVLGLVLKMVDAL
jgi:hypothetical protein